MDVDFIDEFQQIEKEIDHRNLTLQTRSDKYEKIEIQIHNVKQLQPQMQFVLDNVWSKKDSLNKRFKNISLNCETYVEKLNDCKDSNEVIYAKINELAAQRKELLEELTRLRKIANDNEKKLARARAMITEEEIDDFNYCLSN